MTADRNRILTVPRLDGISWLVHGFGTADWMEDDFASSEALRDFRPVYLRQIHTDIVRTPDPNTDESPEGDAWITDVPGFLLVIKTADCLPLLLADPRRRAVGAVHCGWRSTRLGIAAKAVQAMEERFGADPAAIIAALGPCIGTPCYEVGPEVAREFRDAGLPDVLRPHPSDRERSLLDIREANKRQLLKSGLGANHIVSLDLCTRCEPALHSWRRDRNPAARMLNFIGLHPPHRVSPQ